MGRRYAETSDITALGKILTVQENEAAEILLDTASSKLRVIAQKYGKDLDAMISESEDYALTVRNSVVQAVLRALSSIADSSPAVTQASQTALGYSASMTFLNAGQSLYFLRNELKDLGILRQTIGALEVYDYASDD